MRSRPRTSPRATTLERRPKHAVCLRRGPDEVLAHSVRTTGDLDDSDLEGAQHSRATRSQDSRRRHRPVHPIGAQGREQCELLRSPPTHAGEQRVPRAVRHEGLDAVGDTHDVDDLQLDTVVLRPPSDGPTQTPDQRLVGGHSGTDQHANGFSIFLANFRSHDSISDAMLNRTGPDSQGNEGFHPRSPQHLARGYLLLELNRFIV